MLPHLFFLRKKLSVLFFTILLFSPIVFGIGISPAQQTVAFERATTLNLTTVVFNGGLSDANVSLAFSGELAPYILFEPYPVVIPSGGMHTFTFLLHFSPEIRKPGKHLIQIYAIESPLGEKKGIVPLTTVNSFLYVVVPYTGKYAEFDVETHDVNIGESVPFTFSIHNLALEDISKSMITLTVLNTHGELVEKLTTKPLLLPAQTTHTETLHLSTTSLEPGPYQAIASLTYDDEISSEKEIPFRIGTLSVALINLTTIFMAEEINKFTLEVENRWNLKIASLYGEITLLKEGQAVSNSLRTPSLTLEPWEKKSLTAFLDTHNLAPGDYSAKITLFYHDVTTEETRNVTILPQPLALNWTYILTGIIVLIILFDALLWLRHRRKVHEAE